MSLPRELGGGSTARHRLAALSSLFEYLCEKNAHTHNPVKGVKRPRAERGEGKTPAIGDHQARDLLAAPSEDRIKDTRDRAILSTLLYHALRREELCKAKAAVAAERRRPAANIIPLDPAAARRMLDRALARDPETASKLTMAARKAKGAVLSDEEVRGLLEGFSRTRRSPTLGGTGIAKVTGDTPAETILKRLGIAEPGEIDLEAIAWDLGVRIRYRPLKGCEARIVWDHRYGHYHGQQPESAPPQAFFDRPRARPLAP